MNARRKLLLSVILVGIALSERLFFDLGPNIELITVATLLAGVYLGWPYSFFVPFLTLAISDISKGNTSIFLFTWSAYLIIGASGLLIRRFHLNKSKLLGASFAAALFSSVFFYLFTNFGVWLLGWYPPTFAGLTACYLMGLPFLKLNLIGNLIFVPLGFTVFEMGRLLVASARHAGLPPAAPDAQHLRAGDPASSGFRLSPKASRLGRNDGKRS